MGNIVHSISGGKTSAYLSAHYPADDIVFSLVCVDNTEISFDDHKLRQRVNDKFEDTHTLHWGEFTGTPEDPGIIKTVFDLEQHLGKEIKWVRGESFNDLIKRKKALPNKSWRFCTTEMKLRPIFKWCFMNYDLGIIPIKPGKGKSRVDYLCANPVKMGIGYRWDEAERADKLDNDFEIVMRNLLTDNRTNKFSTFKGWRKAYTPLIDDEISYFQVNDWAAKSGIEFVPDSNCQMCFYKPEQQLLHNLTKYPGIKDWALKEEDSIGRTFKTEMAIADILELKPDPDFVLGGGSGCQSGMCTD